MQVLLGAVQGVRFVVGDSIIDPCRQQLLRCNEDTEVCARCKLGRLPQLKDKVYGWHFGERRPKDLNFLGRPLQDCIERWGIDEEQREEAEINDQQFDDVMFSDSEDEPEREMYM